MINYQRTIWTAEKTSGLSLRLPVFGKNPIEDTKM